MKTKCVDTIDETVQCFWFLFLSFFLYFAFNLADWLHRRSNISFSQLVERAHWHSTKSVYKSGVDNIQPKCIDDWPEIWQMCVIHTFGNLLSFQLDACFRMWLMFCCWCGAVRGYYWLSLSLSIFMLILKWNTRLIVCLS